MKTISDKILNKTLVVSLLIMALAPLFSLTSCGGDDPDEPEIPISPDEPEIPVNPEDPGNTGNTDKSNYLTTLLNHVTWSWWDGIHDNGFFTFYETNKIYYLEAGKSSIGSFGEPNLNALGTFSINGNTLTATYDDVSVSGYLTSSEISKHFPGWRVGQSRTVRYTIKSLTDDELTLTDGTNTWNLEPFF